jgi:hypothetical protein
MEHMVTHCLDGGLTNIGAQHYWAAWLYSILYLAYDMGFLLAYLHGKNELRNLEEIEVGIGIMHSVGYISKNIMNSECWCMHYGV